MHGEFLRPNGMADVFRFAPFAAFTVVAMGCL